MINITAFYSNIYGHRYSPDAANNVSVFTTGIAAQSQTTLTIWHVDRNHLSGRIHYRSK